MCPGCTLREILLSTISRPPAVRLLTRPREQELLDTLRTAEAAENRERTQRKLAHQAGLPTSGRGSASHWRHSDVLDWDVPPAGGGGGDPSEVGLTGGRQHKESRRQALVFERLRDSVRQIQEGRNSAGPVRFDVVIPFVSRRQDLCRTACLFSGAGVPCVLRLWFVVGLLIG